MPSLPHNADCNSSLSIEKANWLPSLVLMISKATRRFERLEINAESLSNCRIFSRSIRPSFDRIRLCNVDETTVLPDGLRRRILRAYGYMMVKTLKDGSSDFAIPSSVLKALALLMK